MKTLVDVLLHRAELQSYSDGYLMLGEDGREDERLNYEQLDRKAKRVGAHLQSLGMAGERILLLYPAGLEFISAFMGCLYAGAVAVPVPPPGRARSMERFRMLVADCDPALVLTTRSVRGRLQQSLNGTSKKLVSVETEMLSAGMESNWRPQKIAPHHLALLQYTSGSTSAPKGTMVTHQNLMYVEGLIQEAFAQTPESVVASWLPFYHDMGLIGGILQPMFTGAQCILMSPMRFLRQPASWLQAISKYRVTTSGGPDFAYAYCVQKITANQREALDLSSWRVAFSGSEPVRAATLESFAREFSNCGFRANSFHPCYGLAEATLLVSGFKRTDFPVLREFCSDGLQRNRAAHATDSGKITKFVSSGAVAATERVVIVDPESLKPCDDRSIGEVWVAGPGVAQGYWNKPEESAAAFGARLNGEPEEAFLRTGDLGFFDDGELFISGRLKDLIIIRGVNHFPQDIEQTVCECHLGLRSASGAAFSIVDDTQAERLVIVQEIEKRPGLDLTAVIHQIRTALGLRHELQAHAIVLIRAGTIPKTSSGKVQRHACREAFLHDRLKVIASWQHSRGPIASRDEAANNPFGSLEAMQSWLISELGSLLGISPDTINLDFTISDCGGDSLTAIEMVHRIETLGIALPVSYLLERATISRIASQLLASSLRELPLPSVSVLPDHRQHPLSYGQQALWFLQRMAPENSVYNLSIAFSIHGVLDRHALKLSFQKLVMRHTGLRSTFGEVDGHPVQFVHEMIEPAFAIHEAETWTAEFLSAQITQEMNRPFDIENGPLLRIALYARGEQAVVLQVTVHHLVADFWSLAIALEEIGQLYAVEVGAAAAPPRLSAPAYGEFVQYQSELLHGLEGERLWNYWRLRLEGELPVCALPADRPRVVRHTYPAKTERMRLGYDLVTNLKAFAREQGCTLYMVLLAAFKVVLFRHTDCADILIGSPAVGRMSSRFSRLIGYCVNPLPLRTQFDSNWSFLDLMAALRNIVTGAFAHQQYPFPLLVERLQAQRTSARTSLFQMMFTFLGKMRGHSDGIIPLAMGEAGVQDTLHDLEIESLSLDQQFLDFDLILLAGDSGDTDVTVALHYSKDLFDSTTMVRLLGHWRAVMSTMVENPGQIISSFPLLNARERKELTSIGDGPQISYTAWCIHRLIEDAVQRGPGRVAVVFGNEEVTYGLLNRRANQLANHVRSLGAGPDIRIGICLHRSVEMVISLLAILKSGSAYVPLDPSYPKERLAYIIEDAHIGLMITTAALAGMFASDHTVKVCLDADAHAIAAWPDANLADNVLPDNLAYVIYTSGSTGQPKGVMITHGSVANLFCGMDGSIGDQPGAWLAVTSISFDISVLELLWTLSHSFKIEIARDRMPMRDGAWKTSSSGRKLDFSLFYFAATDSCEKADKYRLLLESARFADQNGFHALWTPERHFHPFGGLYPNPSVTGAALAAVTSRIRIRAGSVVLPLHHPARVAEEWSVVDNLSNGRVDISFASGWHIDDFALAPQSYAERKNQMVCGIETVRKLWRGEAMPAVNGGGQETAISIFPRPCQPELPVWITAGGSSETFQQAGELGAGLLTHLLGQSLDELEQKIAIYREARHKSGATGDGHVTLMLHTFLGEDMEVVRETVRGPFCEYLRQSISLISGFARSLNIDLGPGKCTAEDMDALLQYAFDRYFETSGLFGTLSSGTDMVHRVRGMGVDEIACLIDFGIDNDSVMQSLRYLKVLRDNMSGERETPVSRITHLQCTPSLARMLLADSQSTNTMASVDKLLIGGEPATPALMEMLSAGARKEIYNMYGPTETTVWSSIERVIMPGSDVSLGRPLANTRIHILDSGLNPAPMGVPGEICIGGDGVARGYLHRPALTAAKFIPDPLSNVHGARLYRTGDRGRWRRDGKLEFQGRLDFQAKVRGHRIECGEIEACLDRCPGIKQVAVKAVQDADGNTTLAAYIVPESGQPPSVEELRKFIAATLPDYMIPSCFIVLSALPLTPNGKIDRNHLPEMAQAQVLSSEEHVAPGNAVERVVADLWSELLNVEKISIHANFFAAGGHSLLATALVSKLREVFQIELSLETFFNNPTVSLLSAAMLRANGEQLCRTAEIVDAVSRLSEEAVESALRTHASISLS